LDTNHLMGYNDGVVPESWDVRGKS
jgi:hypothetical protein